MQPAHLTPCIRIRIQEEESSDDEEETIRTAPPEIAAILENDATTEEDEASAQESGAETSDDESVLSGLGSAYSDECDEYVEDESGTEVVDDDDAFCTKCKGKKRAAQMLLCDGCNQGMHLFCMEPPLDAVPDGDYYCVECHQLRQQRVEASEAPPLHTAAAIESAPEHEPLLASASAASCAPPGGGDRRDPPPPLLAPAAGEHVMVMMAAPPRRRKVRTRVRNNAWFNEVSPYMRMMRKYSPLPGRRSKNEDERASVA